jgi:hypothetical protein
MKIEENDVRARGTLILPRVTYVCQSRFAARYGMESRRNMDPPEDFFKQAYITRIIFD